MIGTKLLKIINKNSKNLLIIIEANITLKSMGGYV